jgi:hypothetical protein
LQDTLGPPGKLDPHWVEVLARAEEQAPDNPNLARLLAEVDEQIKLMEIKVLAVKVPPYQGRSRARRPGTGTRPRGPRRFRTCKTGTDPPGDGDDPPEPGPALGPEGQPPAGHARPGRCRRENGAQRAREQRGAP